MKKRSIAILCLLSVIVLAANYLNPAGWGQGDEAMHIATVRDTMAAKSYFVPVLDGIPNYYKPPLLFWLGVSAEAIFGSDLYIVRLSSLLFGFGTVLLLFHLLVTFRVDEGIAFMISSAYLLSIGLLKFSALLMMEQGMAFFLLLTTYGVLKFVKTRNVRWIILAAMVSGVAFLFKGPLFQVYTLILFAIPSLTHLIRFQFKPFRWVGKKALLPILGYGSLFAIFTILPVVVWATGLSLSYGKSKDLLQFFFMNENVGKFFDENQSETRLLGGWIAYTFPWTLVSIFVIWMGFKKRIHNYKSYFGRILLLGSIFMILMHFLPNRKAAYYVLPMMPLFFASAGLLLLPLQKQFNTAMKWNSISIAAVGVVYVAAGIYFGLTFWENAILIGLLIVTSMGLVFWQKLGEQPRYLRLFLLFTALCAILPLQMVFLPRFSLPIVPENVHRGMKNEVCLVSPEPWDGFALSAIYPNLKIEHTLPDSPVGCENRAGAVIYYQTKPKSPAGLARATWPVWREKLEWNDVISSFGNINNLTMEASYHERK